MKLSLYMYFILMVSICYKTLPSKTTETTSVRFILDYVDKWNIKYPKVFLPEGAKYSTKLWSQLSSRGIQAIVWSGIMDATRFLKVLERDNAKMEVFVSGNYNTVRLYLEKLMTSTLPNYRSSFVLICYDCSNDTINFHLNNSHDILSDIVLAVQNKAQGIEYFYLYGLTYDYRSNCLEKVLLGQWHLTNGFSMTSDAMPNNVRNFKYHNAILHVMTIKMEPYLLNYDDPTGESVPRGPGGDMFKVLSERLEFKFQITQSKHELFGELTQQGKFNLAIGEFVEKKFDLALGDFSLSPHRKSVVDFTRSLFRSESTFFFRHNLNDTSGLWKTSIKPFKGSVWLVLAIMSLGLALILRIASCSCKYVYLDWPLDSYILGFYNIKDANSTRIIIITINVLFFMVCSSYTAVMISSFTTVTPSQMITFKDLALSNYSIIMGKGGMLQEVIKTTNNPVMKQLKVNHKIVLVPNRYVGVEKLCIENNMALNMEFMWKQRLMKNCTLYHLQEVLFAEGNHFITQKGQVLSKRVSTVLTRMEETGIMHRILMNQNYIRKIPLKSEKQENGGWVEISNDHLKVAYGILTIGILMSIASLVYEMVFPPSSVS